MDKRRITKYRTKVDFGRKKLHSSKHPHIKVVFTIGFVLRRAPALDPTWVKFKHFFTLLLVGK
jgi:hypothetical protein